MDARASVGASLLSTIFAAAVTSYLAAHLAAARIIGRPALAGLALAHGYHTAFWWTAGIFAAGAVIGGVLLRRGPLDQKRAQSRADDRVTTARTWPLRESAAAYRGSQNAPVNPANDRILPGANAKLPVDGSASLSSLSQIVSSGHVRLTHRRYLSNKLGSLRPQDPPAGPA